MRRGLGRIFAAFFLLECPLAYARTIQISVTGAGYGPSSANAAVGDLIEISFTVGSATFTQSSLDDPCVSVCGIDSGLKTVNPGAGPQSFSFIVTTSEPLFFFNSVENLCQRGFVFTLNAPSQEHFQFVSNAQDSADLSAAVSGQACSHTSFDPSSPHAPASPSGASIQGVNSTAMAVVPVVREDGVSTSSNGLHVSSHVAAASQPPSAIIPTTTHVVYQTFTSPSIVSTMEPTPTKGSPRSRSKIGTAALVIGPVLLGLLVLSALVFVIRRRQTSEQSLSTSTGRSSFRKVFPKAWWGWVPLDAQKKHRQITPFLPERGAQAEGIRDTLITFTTGRRRSQATLVASTEARPPSVVSSVIAEASEETGKRISIHRGRITINTFSLQPQPPPYEGKSDNTV